MKVRGARTCIESLEGEKVLAPWVIPVGDTCFERVKFRTRERCLVSFICLGFVDACHLFKNIRIENRVLSQQPNLLHILADESCL